ncbi:hypothetical protein Ciccas_011651, partial [Cichlidogyrus casuarinus]
MILAAFLSCALANLTFIQFACIFGVLGGIGMSLIYLPALATLSLWYSKGTSVAVSFALCGSGTGTVIISVFLSFLSTEYSWREIQIYLCMFIAQAFIAAAFLRPIGKQFKIEQLHKKYYDKARKDRFLACFSHPKSASKDKITSGPHRLVTKMPRNSFLRKMLEDKSRQLTVSTRSLDGMVITRDNEIVLMSNNAHAGLGDISSLAKRRAEMVSQMAAIKFEQEQNKSSESPAKLEKNPSLTSVPTLPIQFEDTVVEKIAHAILKKLESQLRIPAGCAANSNATRRSSTASTVQNSDVSVTSAAFIPPRIH